MSPQLEGVTLGYVIPQHVREIRPPVMDQWHVSTTTALQETPVHPTEETFLKAVHTQTHIDTTLLKHALQFIKQYHESIPSNTETPAYLRAIAVAHIVLGYTHDSNTLLAALMRDIVDKTHCSLHQIALHFNPVVQRIVEGVASVDSRLKSYKKLQLSPHEALRKLLTSDDERVCYIKIADRLHSMRTMQAKPYESQCSTAEETLRFFVPLAKKLGLKKAAKELKEHCLTILHTKK